MKLNKFFNNRNINKKGKGKSTIGNEFKIDGYTTTDMQSFIEDVGIEDDEIKQEVYIMLAVTALTIVMLIQLRYSTTESSQYFDGLPSTKFYKKKLITTTPGVVWCTMIPTFETYDFLGLSLVEILETFIGEPILPVRKINKLTKENCTDFFKARRTSILGSLNSCPATQSAYFNLDSNCVNWTTEDALKFIFSNGLPADITKEQIVTTLCELTLTTGNDNKLEQVTFDEPSNINSKIENVIFENKIIRNNKVDTTLKQSGNLPDNRLTEENLQQVFNASEIRRYKVALRFGDKSTLKQLNELAKTRLAEQAKSVEEAAPAASSSSTNPVDEKAKPTRKLGSKSKPD